MKLDYSKVYIKNGNDTKAVDVEKLVINGVPLSELLGEVATLKNAYTQLTEELQGHYIVKKDTSYIIEIDGQLKRVNDLKLFESQPTRLPLRFYKIVDGKLVENKRKIGAIL